MSLRISPYSDNQWASSWTIFYWAWVIAWSPFVGTFVARVSRGRTIKEYVFGVLFVPPLLACLWIGVFGFFVTSCGFGLIEQAAHWAANQVDHGDEVGLVPVAACA